MSVNATVTKDREQKRPRKISFYLGESEGKLDDVAKELAKKTASKVRYSPYDDPALARLTAKFDEIYGKIGRR